MCSHTNEPRPRRTWRTLALALAALPLAGCACEEFESFLAADAEAAMVRTTPNCRLGSLARLSKTSATLAERADPSLLAAARREAERECYRARARMRFDTAQAAPN